MGAYTPEVYVEVAFGFGPYDEPSGANWVDISDYVDLIETERGRTSEFDSFPASTCTLTLDNWDRRFDPLNSSSPYVGLLQANTPVRVYAKVSAVDHPIWRGVIDGWPCEYHNGGFERVLEVPCTDVFKTLAERPMPDVYTDALKNLSGVGVIRRWYRMDGTKDNIIRDTIDPRGNLTVTGQWNEQNSIAAAGVLPALGLEQYTAPANAGLWPTRVGATCRIGSQSAAPFQNDYSAIAFVVRFTDHSDTAGISLELVAIEQRIGANINTGVVVGLAMYLTDSGPTGAIYATWRGTTTSVFTTSIAPNVSNLSPIGADDPQDGLPHTVVVVRKATTLEIWIDGVLGGTNTNGSATGVLDMSSYELNLHHPLIPTSAKYEFPGVVMQDIMFFDVINPATFSPVQVHAAMMFGNGGIMLSGDAIGVYLDLIGWPASLRDIDQGEVLVELPENPYGESTLKAIQRIADTEGGRLFVDAAGRVTFHSSGRFVVEPVETTVQYSFADNDPSSVSLDDSIRVVIDDQFVYDGAEVTRRNGDTQKASVTATPVRTLKLDDLLFTSDNQALNRAEKIVFLNGTAQPRTDAWGVWPEADTADWPTILDLEIGTRVAYVVTPAGVGSQISLQQHLQQIEHTISPTDWSIRMNGTPTDNNTYFTWGGPGAQGWGNGGWR